MPAVLFGVALVVAGVLLVRGFLSLEPHDLARILRWTGAAVAIVVAVLLVLSGREGLLITGAILGAPLFMNGRWRRWLGGGAPSAGAPAGRTSSVVTRLLRMTLDHDSGRLSGEVVAGRFRGRRLEELSFDEAMELLRECRAGDAEALPVLETWLERMWGPDWRQREAPPDFAAASPPGGPLTRDEALSILGLEAGASPEAVREAHRRLMARVHPDHGGSTWLAAKLNQARDLLLKS